VKARAELRAIERETTRIGTPRPGDTVFREPPRPEAGLRRERVEIDTAEAEHRHQEAQRREYEVELRHREAELRRREDELRQYEAQRQQYQPQYVARSYHPSPAGVVPSRSQTPRPRPESGIVVSESRPDYGEIRSESYYREIRSEHRTAGPSDPDINISRSESRPDFSRTSQPQSPRPSNPDIIVSQHQPDYRESQLDNRIKKRSQSQDRIALKIET
jgi:hypothetical protein